jgi:hypothetical protein
MDVNFMKMHNPTNAAPKFAGKSHLGDYSDSLMELDDNIGRVMDAIRAEAPNAIVNRDGRQRRPGRTLIPTQALRLSAARKARRLKVVGECRA